MRGAQPQLPRRLARRLAWLPSPLAAGDDHLLQCVSLDMHAALEPLGKKSRHRALPRTNAPAEEHPRSSRSRYSVSHVLNCTLAV